MKKHKHLFRTVIITVVLHCCALPLTGQENDDRARRTLESGIQFYQRGDYKNALQDFNTIVKGYSQSDLVDEALLWMARYANEVESDQAAARQHLQTIITTHPDSDTAPAAYFYLGQMLSGHKDSEQTLRDSLANFERVERFFPESELADNALYNAAAIHIQFKEYEAALAKLQRLLGDYPDSDIAAEARYAIGTCFYYLNDLVQSMIEFQEVRTRAPDSPMAERALDRLTLLYRLHFADPGPNGPFTRDASFSISLGRRPDDLRYIQFQGAGDRLLLSDRGSDVVYTLDMKGAAIGTQTVRRPTMAKPGLPGLAILADRRFRLDGPLILYPNQRPNDPLRDIEAFDIGPDGKLYIYDSSLEAFLVFDRLGKQLDEYASLGLRDVEDVETDAFGNIYILDRRERRLYRIDADTRRSSSFGPQIGQYEWRDPVALDIDEGDHLYVLDRREKAVYIFGRDGTLLIRQFLGANIDEPVSVTVAPDGALYIVDRGSRQVYRYE